VAARVLCSVEGHVAVVTLNRADKHNAVDMGMFEALATVGDRIASDPAVRAVVLHGAGANFCAGIDVAVFQGGAVGDLARSMAPAGPSPANLFQRAAYVWREVPVPVICAVTGIAYGAGLQIALGADLRFARPDARFSVMEIKWGLIPDMAITTTLHRLLPADKLKELVWTGRVFDGEEAARLGVVTALHEDPLGQARALAAEIVTRSPDAIRADKRLIDDAWCLAPDQALRLEARLQLAVLGRPNQVEAVRANRENRAPEFADPESEKG
jgi:enoyl-CoA hydratase/carnithine racemase